MGRREWVAGTAREFASLRGRRVGSWVGVEMALREGSGAGDEPRFRDPQVPFLQLYGLDAALDGGGALNVTTYQDSAGFGLQLRPEHELTGRAWDGIFRLRSLTELPTGRVEEVVVLADGGVLAEVHLRVGGRPLLLVAGEVDETVAGGLSFRLLDESVLVFTDPAAVEAAPWTTSRRGLTPIPG